jgi:pimeloyl-ACP methyl ester carboxylesterase
LVLFLHGFPDTHRGFLPAMDAVAAAGYRAVAPEPRGYFPTDIPADGDYRVEAFANDVVGIADALGDQKFSLVGHDWGALTAYAVANLAPARVDRLITAAVPHTGHFLVNIRLRQAWRSRYMAFFQLAGVAEHTVARHDFAYVAGLLREWSPTWDFGEVVMDSLRDVYADRPRLTAALSYYRGLPSSIASAQSRRLIFAPVTAPTRMLYGTGDGCIGPELFANQQNRFQAPLDLVPVPDCGHFIQWEQPEIFIDQVLSFLDAPTPGTR